MAHSDEVAAKRDSARRARRLASQFADPADRARTLAFAEQLEAEAEALEQGLSPPPSPRVTHVQQQPQQQEADEPGDGMGDGMGGGEATRTGDEKE